MAKTRRFWTLPRVIFVVLTACAVRSRMPGPDRPIRSPRCVDGIPSTQPRSRFQDGADGGRHAASTRSARAANTGEILRDGQIRRGLLEASDDGCVSLENTLGDGGSPEPVVEPGGEGSRHARARPEGRDPGDHRRAEDLRDRGHRDRPLDDPPDEPGSGTAAGQGRVSGRYRRRAYSFRRFAPGAAGRPSDPRRSQAALLWAPMPAGTFAPSSSPPLRSSASRRTTTCPGHLATVRLGMRFSSLIRGLFRPREGDHPITSCRRSGHTPLRVKGGSEMDQDDEDVQAR